MLVLVDESGSMGGKLLQAATAATLMLDRAAAIAGLVFGVWGFKRGAHPLIHRPLVSGHCEQEQQSIAPMEANRGTLLCPVFQQAARALVSRSEQVRLLLLFHDGALSEADGVAVRQEVQLLRGQG
ncbi:MAG: hypothetical protein AB4426_24900 [Xenococcaceae cyanobacterium]